MASDLEIKCPRCGRENREQAKFCLGCGARLPAPDAEAFVMNAPAVAVGSPPQTPVTTGVTTEATAGSDASTASQPPAAESSGQICQTCQQPNRIGAKVCRRCGQPLTTTRRCARCQAENRWEARHCRQCGYALMTKAPPRLGTGQLTPQTLIGRRYLILKKLAQGGMGAVYLVKDTHLSDPYRQRDKLLALKEMSESAFPSDQLEQAVRMFHTEATVLADLHHPNLPQVTDFFQYKSKFYLVMTYIQGDTLEALLRMRNQPFPLKQVLRWANQLCGVLNYLHNQTPPIIYRDLKPNNIMLESSTGLLKLIDFGIARFQYKKSTRHHLLPGQTLDDIGIGTAGYAAPEQWKQGEATPQSDIYGLGVTLHQLLTNHDPQSTLFSLPPISELNPQVPMRISQVIAKAYALNLSERYERVIDFERALGKAQRELGL